MPKITVPVGEFAPDAPDYQNPGSSVVTNVLPKTETSYGPLSALAVYSSALTARCQGAYAGLDTAGNVNVFSGDATKLYRMTSASSSFAEVSVTPGAYSIPADGMWKFAFMNGRVIATDYTDAPQGFLIDSDTNFSVLSVGAPKARYCAVIKNFLALANTTDATFGAQPQRVWWGALNDPTNWPTPGTSLAAQVQSDYQDIFGEGGWIQAIVGNLGTADGAVIMEHAVWRMVYSGPPTIFSFLPAEGVKGTPAPNSVVQFGAFVYYLSENGFEIFDGTMSQPIGFGKVDKYFYSNVDQSNMHRVVAAVDPINKIVMWAAPFAGNSGGNPNVILFYHTVLNRWSIATGLNLETIARVLSFGYTLDTLDNTGYNLDTLPYSLDSRIWTGGNVLLSAFDASHKLNFFSGANLPATVDTTEGQLFPGKRGLIRSARPLVEGAIVAPKVAIGTRDRLFDAVTMGSAVAVNSIGLCPQRVAGRYARAEITTQSGETWTHIEGVEIDAIPLGER